MTFSWIYKQHEVEWSIVPITMSKSCRKWTWKLNFTKWFIIQFFWLYDISFVQERIVVIINCFFWKLKSKRCSQVSKFSYISAVRTESTDYIKCIFLATLPMWRTIQIMFPRTFSSWQLLAAEYLPRRHCAYKQNYTPTYMYTQNRSCLSLH